MTQSETNAKVLGITGGVGSGKSTVLAYLQERYGAELIRCDDVARELQMPGGACFPALCRLLEPYGCLNGAALDRGRMAQVLFHDAGLLEQVNGIVHPAVRTEVERRIRETRNRVPLIVIEAALLVQAGYKTICDEIWFVRADRKVRASRLEKSRGYSPERIRAMFEAQPEDRFFETHTQLTIDNSTDDVQNTYGQIDRGLREHGFLQYRQREQRELHICGNGTHIGAD